MDSPLLLTYSPSEPSAISVEVDRIGPGHGATRMPPHGHLFFELMLLTEGSGSLTIAGREVAVRRRVAFVVPPGVEHDCRRIGSAEGWQLLFLADAVDPGERAGFGAEQRRVPAGLPFDLFRLPALQTMQPIALDELGFAEALRLIERMQGELQEKPLGYDLVVRSALQMLLVTIGRFAGVPSDAALPAPDRDSQAFVAVVFDDIDQHYAERHSLAAAARRLDLQPGHLTTKLRRLSGRTYGAWVIERRMIEARALLAGSTASLAEIAERLGYAEIESFVRRFREYHAMTPGRWRRHAAATAARRAGDGPDDELRSIGALADG